MSQMPARLLVPALAGVLLGGKMSDGIDAILERNGLTVSGKSSQAYAAVRKAFDSGDVYDEILGYEDSMAKRTASGLYTQRVEAEHVLSELKEAEKKAKDQIEAYGIKDTDLVQAVNVYAEVLGRTKDIVAEDMTEEIWLKTIEAASYGMWRSIMGPKFDDKGQGRRW